MPHVSWCSRHGAFPKPAILSFRLVEVLRSPRAKIPLIMGHEANEAFQKVRYGVSPVASACLKQLLEEKHLYQHLSLGDSPEFNALLEHKFFLVGEKEIFTQLVGSFLSQRFTLAEKQLSVSGLPVPCFIVGNVKLFCSTCAQREAFRPVCFFDITNQLASEQKSKDNFKISFDQYFQLFHIVYQCQVCEGIPNVFLFKRNGLTLTIEGRSPIEHIELPTFIPKKEKKWLSDAVVAYQSGKVLAGIFYLRTFIEQFARRITGTQNERKTGDEIMDAYAQTIKEDIRGSFPSLKEWYDKLSEAAHTANEDDKLFEQANADIERHFDFRRLHKLASDAEKKLDAE